MLCPMWVRVWGWMLVDDEPPMPVVGSLLRSVGVRVRGIVTVARNATPDGVVRVPQRNSTEPHRSAYALTGVAGEGHDFTSDTGRRGERHQHAGAEFLLRVGAVRFLVHFDGHAAEVPPGSRVTGTGDLELVAEYEWDAFGLPDTRADWKVTELIEMGDGDILVDLAAPQSD